MRTYGKLNPEDKQANKGNNRANEACKLTSNAKPSAGGKENRDKKLREYSLEEVEQLYRDGLISGVELNRRKMGFQVRDLCSTSYQDMFDGFIKFIKERECVRVKKEAGEERPWTNDEILDKTKFTNIFREDDKVSKFIFDKVEGLEGLELFYNILVGRFINRIDALSKVLPNGDLTVLLEGEAVFLNSSAYQLSPGLSRYNGYDTVREFVVYELPKRAAKTFEALDPEATIAEATEALNNAFGKSAVFVMHQVASDWHHLTGQLVDSPVVRVGQGAAAVIGVLVNRDYDNVDVSELARAFTADLTELLQEVNKHLDRPMTPTSLEHSACEYRKYLYRKGKVLSHYRQTQQYGNIR